MWMQWGIYTGPPGAKFRNLAAAEQSMLIAQATVKCAFMPMWRVLNSLFLFWSTAAFSFCILLFKTFKVSS